MKTNYLLALAALAIGLAATTHIIAPNVTIEPTISAQCCDPVPVCPPFCEPDPGGSGNGGNRHVKH